MDSTTYLNRELSWLEFSRRVFEEARDENVPLLERVKFLAIFSSNLDEFFMVRVARLKRQIRDGIESIGPDGLTHTEALTAISHRVHELAEEQHLCFLNTILPQLTGEDIHLVRPEEMSREQERFLKEFFHRTLYPIVTPLARVEIAFPVIDRLATASQIETGSRDSGRYGQGMVDATGRDLCSLPERRFVVHSLPGTTLRNHPVR
jgi:polyphosphate kinase